MTWGFRVRNPVNGRDVVRAGELGDGTYGVAAINDLDQMVKFDTIAFGTKAVNDPSSGTRNDFPWAQLTGSAAGPIVTDVMIGNSGRCLVTVTCDIDYTILDNGAAGGVVSYTITGATTRAAAGQLSSYDDHTASTFAPGTFFHRHSQRASYASLETGLNPGLHTFTMRYASSFTGQIATFSDRLIIVQPF